MALGLRPLLSRRTNRLLGALVLGAGLVVPGAVSSAADHADDQPDDHAARFVARPTSVVDLGDGDRVRLTEVGGRGHRVLQPLPGVDGTTPGLIISTIDGATTVEATGGDSDPVLVGGFPRRSEEQPSADDLVELRFEAIGRDGRPAVAHVNIFDVETGAVSAYRNLPGDAATECTSTSSSPAACMLVPRGTYSLMALVTTMPRDQVSDVEQRSIQNLSLTGDPEVSVTRDRTIVFDARKARPVVVRTPGDPTAVNEGGNLDLGYTRTAANGRSIRIAQQPISMLDRTFYLQPTEPVRLGGLQSRLRLRLEAPAIRLTAPRGGSLQPEYYDPVWFSDFSSQYPMLDGRKRLRVVDVGHATARDLRGLNLHGAIAVVERSDDLSVAEQSNRAARAGAPLVAIYNDRLGDNGDPNGTGVMLDAPTVRLSRSAGLRLLRAHPRDRVVARGEPSTPYVYDLVLKEDGAIPRDLTYTMRKARDGRPGNLSAQVRSFYGQPTKASTYSEAAYPWAPDDMFSMSMLFPVRGGAQTRVEYRVADPDVRWNFGSTTPELRTNVLFPQPEVLGMSLGDSPPTSFSRGERVPKPVGAAPITAGPTDYAPMERWGDQLQVSIDGFIDADGNRGSSYTTDSGMSTLLRIWADDTVVGETTAYPSGVALVPAGDTRMTVEFTADNPQSWNQLSTHTQTRWTFDSPAVPEGEARLEPVIVADYDVDVDLRNRARGRNVALSLAYADGADPAAIDDVTLDASYDGGRTWRPAALSVRDDGTRRAVLPSGHGYVSLRLRAADAAGSSLDQQIVRAWFVPRGIG